MECSFDPPIGRHSQTQVKPGKRWGTPKLRRYFMQLEKFTQDLFANNEKYTLQRFPKKTSTEIRTTIDGKN